MHAMGYVRFESDWSYNGCRVLRLESDLVRIDVMPELGGKIYHWIHKPEDRDYLWQHPRVKPTILPPGTGYDDTFSGGWDELFPSDSPGEHEGEVFPDHGEYWTTKFDWDVDEAKSRTTLHLCAEGSVTPTRMERWITVEPSSTVVRFRHRLTHLGGHGFDYLWKLHPALRVGPSHEILIPAGKGTVATPGCGRLSAESLEFTWPDVPTKDGSTTDFSKVPASSGVPGYEMVYLTELHDAWAAVLDHSTGSGFGLAFDRELFNNVWLFQSYGGWRGLHVAILEPCTSYPYSLAEAAASGRVARLEGGRMLETETTAVVFTGRKKVDHIDIDGKVV